MGYLDHFGYLRKSIGYSTNFIRGILVILG